MALVMNVMFMFYNVRKVEIPLNQTPLAHERTRQEK
jgi:hypothetical protein